LLYMGSDNGIVFAYPDSEKNVRILHQKDGGEVRQIISVGDGKVIVAIGNELYFMDDSVSSVVDENLITKKAGTK